MTDTAVPLPSETSNPETADTTFNLDQHRRVEALQVARRILENKPGLFAGSKLEPARSVVVDLMTLADWIIAGPDDDTVDLMNGAGEKVTSISTRPYANEVDTFDNPSQERFHDAAADADHQLARSDADDGN